MNTLRVLLVDDSPVFLEAASKFLKKDSRICIVGWARNGVEGVRLARRLAPDVVLMDLNMPVVDGLSATRAIKSVSPAPRVIVVSFVDMQNDRRRAELAMADDFVSKRDFATELPAAITRLFGDLLAGQPTVDA